MTALAEVAQEVSSTQAAVVLDHVAIRRARILYGLSVAIGVAAIVLFSRAVGDATFVLSPRGDARLDVAVPAGLTATVLGLLAIVNGVAAWFLAKPTRAPLVLAVGMVLFVAAVLVWATADGATSLVGLFNGALRRATPLVLGALAGVLCERAGVVNIAIEGMMLGGAFTGTIVGSASTNIVGIIGGVAVGALLGGTLAVLSIKFRVDQVVGGTVINIFALGLTSYLAARILAEYPDLNNPDTFRPIGIPLLEDLPFVGSIVFRNSPHVFAAFLLVAVVTIALFRTRWGLRLRAVGEHPAAADTVGISVFRTRYVAVILGGAMAGLGGTFFTLDSAGQFEEDMVAGRGFIALAALIFGRWHPVGALGAALIFGFAEEFQGRLASLGSPIPSQFLLMAPYLVTLVVVAGLIGKARAPAADGVPYER